MKQASSSLTADLLRFVEQAPTPYHAVATGIDLLTKAGFVALIPTQDWSNLPPGAYFVKPGESHLFAFVLPATNTWRGFRIIGAHTDSPNLRLKPKAAYEREGYAQFGVEVYGGALLNSWLDRDLSLAGRVVMKQGHKLVSRLVRFAKPLLCVPQLAIHLDREINERGLVLNRQEHLNPLLGLLTKDIPSLESLCAEELGVAKSAIAHTELMLYDTQPPALLGVHQEFISSARLDNLAMCHAALHALIQAQQAASSDVIPVIALFDHEEVGSQSAYGAGASTLNNILERIVLSQRGTQEAYHQAMAQSLCVSADMAHAVHPNYADRHDPRHRPRLNAGPVLKINTQQRYATSAPTAVWIEQLAHEHRIPLQTYAHRSDLPCGSTIGPMTSALLGIPTVDIGSPLLSMHSARELGGSQDPHWMVQLLTACLTSSFSL